MRPDLLLAKTVPNFYTPEIHAEFAKLAMAYYPEEVCAYIIDNKLYYVENISAHRENEFELSVEDSLLMEQAQGFIHSHPDGDRWPSALDMQTQIQWNKPFGLVTCTHDSCSDSVWWGDHTLSLPLNERPFVHGITDCYSLIRSEKFQRDGIVLPDFPRNFEWWERGENTENLYDENFRLAGYEVLPSNEELQVGDIVFMKIGTDVVSHAAIYVGNGLILHHLRDRLSREEHVSTWKKFIDKVVRYKD